MMSITALYVALLAILFVVLSIRTIRLRGQFKINIGDAGNTHMQRAMRVHANFAEYVPMALLLMYFVELQNADIWFVHALGAALLVGRLSHAYGVSQSNENMYFRIAGMAMTFTVLVLSAGYLLFSWVQR